MECVNCSKPLGLERHKSKLGYVCWDCKKNNPEFNNSMKGFRIGLGIISVIAAIALIYSLLS